MADYFNRYQSSFGMNLRVILLVFFKKKLNYHGINVKIISVSKK
jgi:hypothetical protein